MMTREEIQEALQQIAFNKSTPFCYTDYIKCPNGRCSVCGSDDLMRITEDDGPEYGTEWIITNLLLNNLAAVDSQQAFEESVESCYPETTQIGWITYNTARAIKELDPTSWQMAVAEWESSEWDEGNLYSVDNGSTFYRTEEVEEFINKNSE